MNKKLLFPLWGCLFILCAGLGFIPEPEGAVRIVLTALSIAFFVPPTLLLYGAMLSEDRHTMKLVRNFSIASLGITLVLLILNFLSALSAQWLGLVLYYVLTIVSSPMICSGYWVLSLFLWACLLMASLKLLRQK